MNILIEAKINKNDEFYTQYEDIENEVSQYLPYLKRKRILCCADSPNSNFWKFFVKNFKRLEIEEVVYTCKGEKRGRAGIYLGGDREYHGFLNGNGDFRSEEVCEIIEKTDVVITNPPFSLFREFVDIIEKYQKHFLIVGNKNALLYQNFFPLFQDGKVRIGTSSIKNFITPYGETQKFGNICWFTSLPTPYPCFLKTNDSKTEKDFLKYTNYDAIHVPKTKDIPSNYNGVMGVPVSFLEEWNPQQFEIIGMGDRVKEIQPLGDIFVNLYKEQGGTGHLSKGMRVLGLIENGKAKKPYGRVLIKKREE